MKRAVLRQVMLSKLLPHLVGCHAHDGVLAGVEIRRKPEKFHTERAFLERPALTDNRVFDNVLKELPASLAGAERRAIQQMAELRPHRLPACLVRTDTVAFAHVLLCGSISQFVRGVN